MSHISLQDFIKATGIPEQDILENITPLENNQENYIPIRDGINLFLQRLEAQLIAIEMNTHVLEPIFLEKTIQILTFLYEQLLSQETTQDHSIQEENTLLKDTLLALQEEAQNKDKVITALENELQKKEEEIQFLKRKHQLMWGKVGNMGMIKE